MSKRSQDSKRQQHSGEPPLSRLEFEMALGIADIGTESLAEIVRRAAQSVGGNLLFTLPLPVANGPAAEQALVRLKDGDENRIVRVCETDGLLTITDQGDIDTGLLGFARASIEVLERLRADARIVAAAA